MEIKDVIAKVLKGDQLGDEEKQFLTAFDLQKQLDAAAGAARKKAEQERDGFKTKIGELEAALEEAKKSGTSSNDTIAKLQKDVAKLMETNKANEAKLAAQMRNEAIRSAVTSANLSCAKGVSQSLFDRAIAAAFDGVDMANEDVVKSTLETFKKDNPALISADGFGGAGTKGKAGDGDLPKVNPFSAKSFNLTDACKLMETNPTVAKQLQEAAAAEKQQ